MLWDNKYKEDYELICNGLFSTLYQVLFGEEAPCLSPKGQKTVKEYGDWYMTLDGVYIRIVGSTTPLHWLPHLVPDTLLLQERSYQTYVNGGCGYISSLEQERSLSSVSIDNTSFQDQEFQAGQGLGWCVNLL